MKTIFRNLAFGILMAGCAVVTATTTFAQDTQDVCKEVEAKQALYKQFTDNFDKKEVEKRTVAVEAGEQYVQKYGACTADKADKDIVDYLNANVPGMKAKIKKDIEDATKKTLLVKFDTAAKSKNIADMFSSGKEILARESDFPDVALDVTIALATAGFDQTRANPPVDTYNADAINYAKSAIQKIEAGKTSKSWGVWSFNLKNDKSKDNKSYALGTLNYIIGNVTSSRQGKTDPSKKKEGLSTLYKSLQYESFSKTDPAVYQAFGAWYLDEAKRIDGVRTEKVKAAGNIDTPETIALLADQKGYADRAIDAYARAYKLAKEDKTQKIEYTNGLYSLLKDLYAFRYDNKVEGIDTFVTSVMSKPLPDPSTPITPVMEEAPAPTTPATTTPVTTKPATTPTKPATTTTPSTTKPATTTPTKPAASTDVSTTTTTKTKAKKPTPKKKGTR